MKESLVSLSLKRFKKDAGSYLAVGFLCGLFLVMVALLSFVDELFFIVSIPLLALPFLFASHISCYLLEANQPITIGAFCRYYISFFRPQFRSSFRGIVSFFKSLAVYFGILMVSYLVLYYVFKEHYGASFVNAADSLINKYLSGMSYDELVNSLKDNDGIMLTFISYVSAIPIPFSITAFIYFVSFYSLSIYYRANINGGTPSLIRLAVANTFSRYRRVIRKDWFKLNYLLVVLPFAGTIIVCLIYFFIIKDINFLAPLLTIGAFVPLIFFLPFYFKENVLN